MRYYIYKMSRMKYMITKRHAGEACMTIEEYVTETFGIRGTCIKAEST